MCRLCVFFRIKCRLLVHTSKYALALITARAVVGGNIIINGALIPSVLQRLCTCMYKRVSHIMPCVYTDITALRKVNGQIHLYERAMRREGLVVLLIFAQNNYWGMRNQSSSHQDWISAHMHIEYLRAVCICNSCWCDAWGVCAPPLCIYSFALRVC